LRLSAAAKDDEHLSRATATDGAARKGRGLARLLVQAAPWAGMATFGLLWLKATREPTPGLSRQLVAAPERFEAEEPGRGRLAAHPVHIPLRGWRDILWRTWLEIGRDRLPAVAGGITFYALLAIFPALAAFISLYGLFADVGTVMKQMNDLSAFVPPEVVNLVGEQMLRLATARHSGLSVAFVVGILVSVWSANAGIAALFDGLNIAYDETEKRNFFARRALTYAFTFAALVFLTLVTAILVAVPIVLRVLDLGESLLVPLRWLLLLAVAMFAFAVMYRFGPSRQKARWRWVRLGAVGAALLWVAGSLGFSWYVNNVGHFDATYGSLAAVVGFMVWIWFSVMSVLLGAELNAEIEHQTALDSTTGQPQPMGQRGAAMADTVGLPFGGVRAEATRLWGVGRRQAGNLMRRKPAAPPAGPEEKPTRTLLRGRPGGRPDPRRSAGR
jgi:membrane protein